MKYISRHALSPVDRNRAVTREGGRRGKIFLLSFEKCFGHTLKTLGPSQKILRPPGVTSLDRGIPKSRVPFEGGAPAKTISNPVIIFDR